MLAYEGTNINYHDLSHLLQHYQYIIKTTLLLHKLFYLLFIKLSLNIVERLRSSSVYQRTWKLLITVTLTTATTTTSIQKGVK